MSFKFFRKHEKVMLWIIVVITIFTFSLFSVTSTMRTCFRQDKEPDIVGTFVSSDGTKVDITRRDYIHAVQLLKGITGKVVEDDIFSHIIMKYEADKAGIMFSDGELNELIKSLFTSQDQYTNFLRQRRFESAKKFEESFREISQVGRYKEFLKMPDELITSETLYERWKLENEEFKVEYVAFPYDEYGKDLTPETITEEELTAYYDGLDERNPDVREYFSEPEKFEFDVAYLDLAKVDMAEYEPLLKDIDVQEHELSRHYMATRDRFLIEKSDKKEPDAPSEEETMAPSEEETMAPAEEETMAPSEGDGGQGGNEANAKSDESDNAEETPDVEKSGVEKTGETEAIEEPEPEPEPEYKPLEEVRDQIEREVKLAKLVEKACYEWTDYARKEKIIGKTAERIAEEEAAKAKEKEEAEAKEKADETSEEKADETGDDGSKAESEASKEEEMTPAEYYHSIIEKYKLLTDKITGPVSLDDLEDIPKYGCSELKLRARYLKENNAVYLRPTEKHPTTAAFVKVTKFVKRRKKDLEEVHEKAYERYIFTKKAELAEEALKTFTDKLETQAKDLAEVKEVIDQWTADAKRKAADTLNLPEDTPEEEAKKLLEQAEKRELVMLDREIDNLVKRYTGGFFAETAAAQNLKVETLDYYRKSDTRKPEFREMEDGPVKFIKSNRRIFDLDTDSVAEPLNDRQDDCWYSVHVVDRRFPPASAMTDEDFESTEMSIEQERRSREYQRRMEMMNPDSKRPKLPPQPGEEEERDPFSIPSLMEDYSLKIFMKDKEEKAEKGAEGRNAKGKEAPPATPENKEPRK